MCVSIFLFFFVLCVCVCYQNFIDDHFTSSAIFQRILEKFVHRLATGRQMIIHEFAQLLFRFPSVWRWYSEIQEKRFHFEIDAERTIVSERSCIKI